MENNICYVFGAGNYFQPQPIPGNSDYVIAADGGYDYTVKCNISVDVVIGDFDSCKTMPTGINTVVLPKEKDDTDMMAALQLGIEKGNRTFYIYGGVGGRVEHTLANIQCLAKLADIGARGFLLNEDNVITAIKNTTIHFPSNAKGLISVFAHSDKATGVYEKGFKYTLENKTLYNTNPMGISNEFIGMPCSISVNKGTLILIYEKNIREVTE